MSTQKPHRIRVRVIDGKPREPNKLKSSQLEMPHLDVLDAKDKVEFVICGVNEKQIAQVRDKLSAAGLEEIPNEENPNSDTNIAAPKARGKQRGSQQAANVPQAGRDGIKESGPDLRKKPYGFVPLPEVLTSSPPVWHDGTSTDGRLSGEIRFEFETLTPLLVGWERRNVCGAEDLWPVPYRQINSPDYADFVRQAARQIYPDARDADAEKQSKKQWKVEEDRQRFAQRVQDHVVEVGLRDCGWSIDSKSVLCPLRAPWGKRPVIIPGDSLKGLLRHELGGLLGAPMERVAERSYSYRPNSTPTKVARLIPRLATVPTGGVEMKPLDSADNHRVRVPTRLELLPENLEFDRTRPSSNYYRFDDGNGAPYRGGQGAGAKLNSKRYLHKKLTANPSTPMKTVEVPASVQEGYLATLRHLTDERSGHFSERHPDHSEWGARARERILKAAENEVFQPGDLIWVEWDTEQKRIVSLGWHYYYRWAYMDSVRQQGASGERPGLFPLDDERARDADGAPRGLSPVRRLFGYVGDNEGSAGIGTDDHSQLMGRVSVNAGLEVVRDSDTDEMRFLPPTFLKELGMPRPSAVEHYLKQPYHPKPRPSDKATLLTYGDAAGYDQPGELAGRKFYLDRKDAYTNKPWEDSLAANRLNERSTLALEASKHGRRFRFTIRFRDLDQAEIAAIIVALCPHQLRAVLRGDHPNGYCSKLGYARPLGWGSVRIEAKALLLLDEVTDPPALKAVPDVVKWVGANLGHIPVQQEWLGVHRHKHPDAADYPRAKDKDGNENIYTFHTQLRADHSKNRRYRGGPNR